MERQVIFRDRQELQSADMNNVQEFAREALDNVVIDGIEPGKAYAGFQCSKTAATVVTVDPGRLYAAGKVFQRVDPVALDLFNQLPLTTRKRVAIVAWGQDTETDVQPRDFLIDAQTGQTEPQSVALEALRRCEISVVAGIEAPDPQYPITDANVLVIAFVVLDTSGVESIEQWGATKLSNVRAVANRSTALENWRSQISGQVDTLRTDLSSLAEKVAAETFMVYIRKLLERVDVLENEQARPAAYLYHDTMEFEDETGSDTDGAGFDAVVNEGIRFPRAASATGAVALLNAQDVSVVVNDNLVLPAYSNELRIDMTGYSAQKQIAQYTFETTTMTKLTRTRQRVRYGAEFFLSSFHVALHKGTFDPVSRTLKIGSETFEVLNNNSYWQNGVWFGTYQHGFLPYSHIRVRQYWEDTYEEDYWDRVKSTFQISGQQVAQTFLNSQDGWLSQIGLYFTQLAASGNVEVLVCETYLGQPNLNRVITRTTLARASMAEPIPNATGLPSLVETKIALPPTFLTAGKRYAIVLVSAADHFVAMTDTDNGAVQGTFFASTDGAFFAGNLQEDMKTRFYFARWARNRYAVDLAAMQLAGGIAAIDILNERQTPGATNLRYEVQVNGIWKSLAPDDQGPSLSALPPLLPLRAVLTGTTDVMPGFGIGADHSQVILSRPKDAFLWRSELRAFGENVSTVTLRWRLRDFDDDVHDFTVVLQAGAGPTQEAADVVTDVVLPDGTTERTQVFNIMPAAQYYIQASGSVTSVFEPFVVERLVETAVGA